MDVLKNAVTGSITTLSNSIGSWFGDLKQSILNKFNDLQSWFSDLKTSIGDWFSSLGDRISGFFIDLYENIIEGIKSLFIPTKSFADEFETMKLDFISKIPIIDDVKGVMNGFLNMFSQTNETMPVFEMSWGGTAYRIIDFSMFDSYRIYIHGIILAFAYIGFFRRLYYRLPSIIMGIGDAISHDYS